MWFQEAKDLARELVGVVTGNEKEAELLVLDSSEEDSYARAVHWWDDFTVHRKAGAVQPFHARRSPYRCRIFAHGGKAVKEYTSCRPKVEAEVALLGRAAGHDGIVTYDFVADEGARISIVMPWAGEPLREHVAARGARFDEDSARHAAHQLASALAHLHAKGIVHRDVKPDNIGILPDGRLRLFDFGEAVDLGKAARLGDRELARIGLAGTPLFMAPESLYALTGRWQQQQQEQQWTSSSGSGKKAAAAPSSKGSKGSGGGGGGHHGSSTPTTLALRASLSPALDVWGLGTVVFFLLARRDVFALDAEWELDELADVAGSAGGVPLPEGATASYAARDFLRRCLERCPERRATARELLQHPWLRGAETRAELEAARAAEAAADARRALRRSRGGGGGGGGGSSSGGGNDDGSGEPPRRRRSPRRAAASLGIVPAAAAAVGGGDLQSCGSGSSSASGWGDGRAAI